MEEKKDWQRYIIKPSTHLFFGRKVTKDLEFHEFTEDKSIEQTLKDCKLTTKVKRTYDFEGIETIDSSHFAQIIPEGTILIWSERDGYTVPNQKMVLADEAIELLKPLLEFSSKEA